MIYPPETLDLIQSTVASSWEGIVFRHMFGSHPPALGNTAGARWNGRDLEAIYTSLERKTALAEAEYYIGLQPLRPKASRTLYSIRVAIDSVVDLTVPGVLDQLGITKEILRGADQSPCRLIGAAVHWLGHAGLLVPSARHSGTNLVIFQQDFSTGQFEIESEERIAEDERS